MSAVQGAPLDSYPAEDQAFYRFWYGHMLNDLMQPPLANVDHATARYIWDAGQTDAYAEGRKDEREAIGVDGLLAALRDLPFVNASEIDGEESDGTPRHYRSRRYVSLTKLERLLRERLGVEA